MSRFKSSIWAIYIVNVLALCAVAIAADVSRPIYVLDLTSASWSNMGLAAIAAQLGGLWGFLKRLTNDQIPKNKLFLHFAVDMIAAVIVGVGIVLFANEQQWTVGNALLAVLGGGVASSQLIEYFRDRGIKLGKPGL